MSGISNHYDTLNKLKTIIDGLSLSGVTTVVRPVWQHQKGDTLPIVTISPFGPEESDDWTNQEDEVGYPCLIAIIAQPDDTTLETLLGWRQKIRRQLRNRKLDSVALPQQYNIIPRPLACVDQQAWMKGLYVSGIVANVQFTEPRT